MDQDNQDRESQKLQKMLRESLAAEQFFNQSSGKLIVELFTQEITRLTRDIASDKYLKDHQGYVNANTELRVYQKILKKLQVANAPERKKRIEQKIKENA